MTTIKHWLKFNLVGIIGVVVQLIILTFLKTGLAMNYLVATILAVETTILHNFMWHEHWTWNDRKKNVSGIFVRLVKFNLSNGLISMVGNVGLMWLFVSRFNVHYLLANIGAILICSVVNFLVSDRLVFNQLQ